MSTAQVTAHADTAHNRLYLTISGRVDARVLEQLFTEIQVCITDLAPGFMVVNNISACQIIYISSLPIYKKIIDYLLKNKAGEIIRIITENNVSCKQIISFTDQIHAYQPLYAYSAQEAEQRLEQITPRAGIRLKLRHLKMAYDSAVGSGEARISDLSTSGCAVVKATLGLPIGMDFEGFLTFPPDPPLISQVQLRGRVVRSSEDGFAARFINLSEAFEEQFYQRLVHEACRTDFSHLK